MTDDAADRGEALLAERVHAWDGRIGLGTIEAFSREKSTGAWPAYGHDGLFPGEFLDDYETRRSDFTREEWRCIVAAMLRRWSEFGRVLEARPDACFSPPQSTNSNKD